MSRNIHLSAAHVPGVDNVQADKESRSHNLDTEWQLKPEIFAQLQDRFGPLEIDLFASRLNHQLPKYAAWRPDPQAQY